MSLISRLIKGISRVLQRSLKCFNGTAILALMIPSLLVFLIKYIFLLVFQFYFQLLLKWFAVNISRLLSGYLILSAILIRIKFPVASPIFWIAFFEAVLIASVADFFFMMKKSLAIFSAHVLLLFLPMFCPNF